jgi:hypothetical protein
MNLPAHVARYVDRVDAHLPTLADDAARAAFLSRELRKWGHRYDAFRADVFAGRPVDTTIHAVDYFTTQSELRTRLGAIAA